MEEEFVSYADVICGHDEGLIVCDEGDVADEGFVEDAIDQFAIVGPAIGFAGDARSWRGRKLAHAGRLVGAR